MSFEWRNEAEMKEWHRKIMNDRNDRNGHWMSQTIIPTSFLSFLGMMRNDISSHSWVIPTSFLSFLGMMKTDISSHSEVIPTSFLSFPGMVKKWHFKSSLSHSWIEWSRNGCTIFENVCSFGRRQHIFMTKSCQKFNIQCVFPRFIGQWMHQMAPSPSQKVRQEHAGTVMHATVVTHALWVTHAVRVAHAARVPTVPTYPPPLRIRSPRGPPKGRPPFPSSL